MSRSGQRRSVRATDNTGLIPILARRVREVEAAAQRGKVPPSGRTKFFVVALLMREERARIKSDPSMTDSERAEQLKRLDGIASILAQTAARDTSLISLLESESALSPAAQALRREYLSDAGREIVDEPPAAPSNGSDAPSDAHDRHVVPKSVKSRQLANPFLVPALDSPVYKKQTARGPLSSWELLSPLYRAFEYGAGGGVASMELPPAPRVDRLAPKGTELMHHQAQLLAAVASGHRSFLLADEPGLGKTAQALLAASVAGAYPLLAIVPNVVKMNWAREVERWTPHRRATVIHGDGDDLDAFADVVIVNYDILDRHRGWLGTLGFQGMVVDEAHFIKNMHSQRSRNVLALADEIRKRTPKEPLMMALTGTPLINDIDDFRAIWQYLGWIDGERPLPALMQRLEATGLTPADPGFFPAARDAVVSMGIVRRRKVDVAADLPSKRIVDLPVELDDELGRSIRQAERELAERLLARYRRAGGSSTDPDRELIRLVAKSELEESKQSGTGGENVFTMVRRIGQAKSGLAADYTAQLARSVGKVVFFAKHVDVLDAAEESFSKAGLRSVSIRGDQTAAVRQQEIDAFNNDPGVSVAVCSLLAAGVGVNLQTASNVVLAELSWTAAEQTQAIDRVHRIGQEEPVTAWRIIAAQTIDAKIAELIDNKQGLAARALDGSDADIADSDSVQLDALVHLLESSLQATPVLVGR